MRRRQPLTPPGRLPPPPGGRDPPPLDRRNDGAAARRRRSPATTTTPMPGIDICTLFIGREDREGDNGSGVATEDDDDTDAEAGGYACDFLEVVLRQLWEGRFGRRRTTTKTTETSRDDKHKDDVVSWSIVRASRRRRCPRLARSAGKDCGEGKREGSVADETITDGAKTTATTERGMHQ